VVSTSNNMFTLLVAVMDASTQAIIEDFAKRQSESFPRVAELLAQRGFGPLPKSAGNIAQLARKCRLSRLTLFL
jgi:hypothetical protein